jgi:hypothetical protein
MSVRVGWSYTGFLRKGGSVGKVEKRYLLGIITND